MKSKSRTRKNPLFQSLKNYARGKDKSALGEIKNLDIRAPNLQKVALIAKIIDFALKKCRLVDIWRIKS